LVTFNIAGAFANFKPISLFFLRNKDLLSQHSFIVYDGINNCRWNGGRINRDISYSDEIINYYYRNNIGIALTFTNNIIDLEDSVGNSLLEKFHRDGNRIILVNEELRKYVRKNYPKYEITHSITGLGTISVPMSDSDFDRYVDLEKKFDFIVPRSEHIFDERFPMLDPKKYEIMLNDTCVYNCKYYGEHFLQIAKQNRMDGNPWEALGESHCKKVEECWIPDFDFTTGDKEAMALHQEDYGMDLKKNQIFRLIDQGVTNFKISGREMTSDFFNIELRSYLLDKLD